MKKLFKAWFESFSGTGFFSVDGSLVTFVHDNDGDWRDEYFSPILKYLDAEMVNLGSIDPAELGLTDDDYDLDGPWACRDAVKDAVVARIANRRKA
jgi:hypothetical protein